MNTLSPEDLCKQLEMRLQSIFEDYAQGLDVPPANRYRTEGFAQALVAMGALSEQQCIELMAGVYKDVFGTVLDTSAMTGLHIPPVMKRAPVFPSSKE